MSTPRGDIALGILFVALIIASITDLARRRIYNWLTFPVAFGAIAFHGVTGGGWALASSLLAFLVCFGLGLFIWNLAQNSSSAFSAGDVKMVMMTAALVGIWPAFYTYFFSNLIMSFVYLPLRWLIQGTFAENMRRMGRFLLTSVLSLAGKMGLGPKTEIHHFKPEGMEDRTPHAPFMLAGLVALLGLLKMGVYPW